MHELLGFLVGFPFGFASCCLLLSRWPEDQATARRLYREYCIWLRTREN